MSTHYASIMEQIDDVKEKLSDGEYLNLCNSLRHAAKDNEESTLYNITFVEPSVGMNSASIAVFKNNIVTCVISPYLLFSQIPKEYIPNKIYDVKEAIAEHGYCTTVAFRGHNGPIQPIIDVTWEDEEIQDFIHVRVERSFEIFILKLEPLGVE
jgi:hypothetical protein